jgi:hypothetical protein
MAQHIELKTSGISWGKKVDREVRRLWNDQKNYTDDEITRDENLYGKNGLFEEFDTSRWMLNEIVINGNKKFREMVDEEPYCGIELTTKSPHSFVIDAIYLVG